LEDNHISTEGIYADENRMTTLKTRFATKGQQLLRVDMEDSSAINKMASDYIEAYVLDNIYCWDAVVLSDYCKGVFENVDFVKRLIKICNDNNVVVAVDSKSRNISAFENADFVKPNNLELENAVDVKIIDDDSFERAGERYLDISGAKSIIVTRGAAGISIFETQKKRRDYAAKEVQVFDVTGAGDTVISAITLGITSGLSMDEAVELANIAAGVVIGKHGTATVSLDELLERIDGK
jgi:D-beta-D-heptose 7-phosphate kinase/D-beta-D-heptose 1-phosphate adenosyltransferase